MGREFFRRVKRGIGFLGIGVLVGLGVLGLREGVPAAL